MSVTRKRLFYDIETSFCSGHFWRPGWNQTIHPHQITEHAKIISIHWKWEGKDEVHNLDWGLNQQCDKKMLEKFIPIMDSATEVITHNGKKFDTPWLRTRCMLHGIEMHHTYNELDTYKLAKKYLNLPSNSLKEVCKYYGLPNKLDAGGIETWINVVYKKDKEALDHLKFYGDGDIISLESVFNKFRPYIKPNLHYSTLASNEKWWCPECGGIGNYHSRYSTAAGTIQHYLKCRNTDCKTYYKISNVTLNNFYQYKQHNGIK